MRLWLRAGVVACAAGAAVSWVLFLRAAFAQSPGSFVPTGAVLLAIVFGGLAISASVAAIRDIPIVVAFAGGLSLVPMGLYMLLFPGPGRWIGLCDFGMLAIGIALVRSDRSGPDDDHSPSEPPPPGSARPA